MSNHTQTPHILTWTVHAEHKSVLSVLDYFHVMTYDFHGSWEQNVGENSPLYQGPADQGALIYFNVVSGVIFFSAINEQ